MNKVTLKDLWKIAKRENQPLLGLTTDLATLDFMSDYLSKNEAFDRDIARNQGFFSPVWNLNEEDTADDVFEQWQKDVYYYLYKNKENYQRLYDLLSITYDPLTNYDKTSVITDQESGTDKDTNVIGARHREDTYAQRQDTDAYGAVSHTDSLGAQQNSTVHGTQETTDEFGAVSKSDVFGAVSESDTIGARSDSLTHGAQTNTDNFGAVSETTTHGAKETGTVEKIAGFNSVGFDNANSSTTNEGNQQDSHTEAARTDSHTTAQYIDNTSVGAQTNSHTENSKTDTHTELAKTDTHTLATYTDTDNIGAQQNTHTESAKSDTHTQGAHKDEFDESQATDELTKLYGHLNTHNERTTGNIGVTTSQQMAQSEIDLWDSFRFYDILFGDIIKELCHFYDEGYDCF